MAKNRYHSLLNAAAKADVQEDEQQVLRNIIQELERQIQNGEEEKARGEVGG